MATTTFAPKRKTQTRSATPTVARAGGRSPKPQISAQPETKFIKWFSDTMTMRTPNAVLRNTDTLDIALADAQRLRLRDGDKVRVRSRHGETVVPLRLDSRVKGGDPFATFHGAKIFLNNLTGPHRDKFVMTHEKKIVAANLENLITSKPL